MVIASKSERDHLHVESEIRHKRAFLPSGVTGVESRLAVAKGEGAGGEMRANSGSAGVSFHI